MLAFRKGASRKRQHHRTYYSTWIWAYVKKKHYCFCLHIKKRAPTSITQYVPPQYSVLIRYSVLTQPGRPRLPWLKRANKVQGATLFKQELSDKKRRCKRQTSPQFFSGHARAPKTKKKRNHSKRKTPIFTLCIVRENKQRKPYCTTSQECFIYIN